MKTAIVFILSALCFSGYAQTAKVIALTPEDAKTAASLDEQQKQLEGKRAAFHAYIVLMYLDSQHASHVQCQASWKSGKSCQLIPTLKGWESGFEFSDDWKYIVPLKFLYSPKLNNSCGISLTPAYIGTPVAN